MQQAVLNISQAEGFESRKKIFEYSDILKGYDVAYTPASFYWRVGNVKPMRGWILHLSVIKSQLPELIELLLPLLTKRPVPFDVIRDYHIAGTILDGSIGYGSIGKMIKIYPENDQEALYWAKKLISFTKEFRGPSIPTDRHLGSIVYTNYETFSPDSTEELKIPFALGKGARWPFTDLVSPHQPIPKKILNHTYYPLASIKKDSKGDVIRGIYFKKLWQIKPCLIKQGRFNMFADDSSRDMQDRLKWQYDIYQKLRDVIPMPVILEYFIQDNDGYLVMEYIKGQALGKWVHTSFQSRTWQDMPDLAKVQLLDKLIQIISIISTMHKRGYIHRDITPENFLLDEKDNLYLIDLELTWNAHTGQPDPPYRLGTYGFMSPEQQLTRTPTEKEDIYGLGGLMITFFLNLSPVKFENSYDLKFKKQLLFFIGEEKVVNLIMASRHRDAFMRPGLDEIQAQLELYRSELSTNSLTVASTKKNYATPDKSVIRSTIQAAINGMSLPMLLSPKLRWASRAKRKEEHIGNHQLGQDVYIGWHTGLAGPLWIMGLANKVGYNIDACRQAYNNSWDYIQEEVFSRADVFPTGLYAGVHGVSLALLEGMKSGLLTVNSDNLNVLQNCFSYSSDRIDLSEGWAGEGIALLQCLELLDRERLQPLLNNYLNNVLSRQSPDGSWPLYSHSGKKKDIYTGMEKGVAGMIWFLLCYLESTSDKTIEAAAQKSMAWLIKSSYMKKGRYNWTVSTYNKETDKWDLDIGIPGILLVLAKAYELFRVPLYKEIVEMHFNKIRPRLLEMDFSLKSGLAGIGELYLELYRVFGDAEWKNRADWIASVFINTFQEIDDAVGYWLVDPSHMATADLFTDNAGIIHFLLRHQSPEEISHPLSTPNTKNFLK